MKKHSNNKLKKITIISIALSIIILLVSIYLKTDLFKTKEQLFWKYMSKEVDEFTQILSNDKVKEYNNTLKDSYYIKEGKISISSKYDFIKPIDIEINEKGNNHTDNENTNVKLKYKGNDVTDVSFIKDGNFYFVKNDLLNSYYIGIENKNLKQLAQKIGMEDTTLIPNEIKDIDFDELFSITPEEQKHISKKYKTVFRKIIKNNNYSKITIEEKSGNEKNNKMSYKIEISENEAKEIVLQILKELYNDDVTLNFISRKISLIDSSNQYCNIEDIKEKVKEYIDYIEEIKTNEKEFASIIIYVNKKNVEKVELMLEDNRTISLQIDKEQNKIIIKQYDIKNKSRNFEDINNTVSAVLDSITEITYSKNVIDGITNKVSINVICKISLETINFNYSYVEQIKNNVDNLLNKDNIKYIMIDKIDENDIKRILEKVLKMSTFFNGKKYYQKNQKKIEKSVDFLF